MKSITSIFILIFLIQIGHAREDIVELVFSKPVKVEILDKEEQKQTKGFFVSGFLAAAYYYYNEDDDFSWSKFTEITVYESIYGTIPGEGWEMRGTKLIFRTSGVYTPIIVAEFDTAQMYSPQEYKNFYDRVKTMTGIDYQDLFEINTYIKPFEPSTISNEIERDIEGIANIF
ncbi:MAG: hypothetical protein GXO22_02625 [Aquificae bacterium]|nr:hypothetical protein [Aquificota bacterium]